MRARNPDRTRSERDAAQALAERQRAARVSFGRTPTRSSRKLWPKANAQLA
jgi:hypothetical protein